MKKILMALVLSGFTLASTAIAQAYSVPFVDRYRDSSTPTDPNYESIDSIGFATSAPYMPIETALYNMEKTVVTINGSQITFDIYSLSDGYFNGGGMDQYPIGDLFLDTNGSTSWNYVVDLATSGVAKLYSVVSTSITNGTVRENQAALYNPGNSEAIIVAGSWNIESTTDYAYDYLSITIDIPTSVWNGTTPLGFHWTMECGNDVVQDVLKPVPEPNTLLLFGTGLAGLAGFARRRVRK